MRNKAPLVQSSLFLIIGILLIGANLRVPLTSVGALIPFIREDLAISNTLAGAITTLPLLAFALLSPFAPRLARYFGIERTLGIALALLLLGIILRSAAGISLLFAGTLFIGLAIAVGNVLIPAVVKLRFPLRVGLITGFYAVAMNVFGALGSGISVPIAKAGLGWKGALAIWGLLTLFTLLIWLPHTSSAPTASVESPNQTNNLWRSRLAWQVTLFMGCQSLIYYTLITWLPDIFGAKGYSENTAGWLVFLMQLALIPVTFLVPLLAEKFTQQVGMALAVASAFMTGLIGLLLPASVFDFVWVILLGAAGGGAFGLSMMFFTLRTQSPRQAAELSGMAQSAGYLFAATGPVLVGALQDISGNWLAPISLLLGIAVLVLLNGIAAGRKRWV